MIFLRSSVKSVCEKATMPSQRALARMPAATNSRSPVTVSRQDDQIVPYADSAPLSAKLLRNSTLKTYQGFSARHAHNQCGPNQCRPARVLERYSVGGSVVPALPGLSAFPKASLITNFIHKRDLASQNAVAAEQDYRSSPIDVL